MLWYVGGPKLMRWLATRENCAQSCGIGCGIRITLLHPHGIETNTSIEL